MDELLALMDESDALEEASEQIPRQPLNPNAENASAAASTSRAMNSSDRRTTQRQTTRVEASIDDQLGIRMIKRQMSSADLLDLVVSNPYHSTAAICAMSRAALNRLLQEPAAVVSEATVCGKTTLVTAGCVFTNSGTKISSNGRAFSVVSIGNLQTGPAISVFLFGDAYSRYCAKCPPGTVVALVAPNLMAPKEGSRDTAVAFSVADHRQLLPVAQARDYGVCKGAVKTKRADGTWGSNGGRCKQYVDVRVNLYCEKHRKQQNVKDGPTNKASFMQKQRMEHGGNSQGAAMPTVAKGVLTMNTPAGILVTHNPNGVNVGQLRRAGFERPALSLKAPLHMQKQPNTSLSLVRDPKTVRGGLLSSNASSRQSLHRGSAADRNVLKSAGRARQTSQLCSNQAAWAITDDWLNPNNVAARSRLPNVTTATKKRTAINRDGGGFDGSVAVPRPSKMFRAKASPLPSKSTGAQEEPLNQHNTASLLENQRLVAQRQKETVHQVASRRSTKIPSASTSSGTKSSAEDSLRASLFGKVASIDVDEVLNAKSRFENEANAEAYARSRLIISDLERREEKTNAIEAKKQKPAGAFTKDSGIQKEWVCNTCKRTTKARPALCIRAHHKVTFKRDVKKSTNATEERLKLDERSSADGGLRLGAGLEWDRRRQQF